MQVFWRRPHLVILGFFLSLAALAPLSAVTSGPLRVLKVIDGDSLIVAGTITSESGQPMQVPIAVRLLQVNAPEMRIDQGRKSSDGAAAKDFVRALLPEGARPAVGATAGNYKPMATDGCWRWCCWMMRHRCKSTLLVPVGRCIGSAMAPSAMKLGIATGPTCQQSQNTSVGACGAVMPAGCGA